MAKRGPFREFKPGDILSILEDRREEWQEKGLIYTVSTVDNHGFDLSKGHPQTLTMTDGHRFSGWWFDPASECLWAKSDTPLTGAM